MNNKVEFKLRFLLNSFTLKVLDIEETTDAKKVLLFNNRFCETTKIYAFCSQITDTTFFPLLGVPLTENSKIHKVYFCEISVGKPLFVTNEYATTLNIPKDYDSFIVSSDDSNGFLTESPLDIFKLSYVIKDTSRILPLYEVTFEYDQEFEKLSRNSFICHKCKKAQSVVFCPSERASFCKECDSQVHHDEFLKRHKRIYFSDVGQKKFICCADHPTNVVEYFCETCMEPLCSACKITGNHSGKEKYDHPIVPFLDACHILKSRILECIKPVEGLAELCDKEIFRFKEKVNMFRSNISDVRMQLEKEFKALMLQLESIENSQRQIINARYAERVAKLELFKRMESYPQSLDPADLLSDFKNIQELTHTESNADFEKYEHGKIELQGKISLAVPKLGSPNLSVSDTKDKSIRWRIETMHMTKENDSTFY
ncbi:Zinc ion binding [Glugoides intestinalis]